ncbi:hypothetical protein XF24_00800 [candidate division SR1 bacterium Aalborg_AAW-1]|nr:hypothetical protein XF24_00800 [candidate division SR1 bacterium Aalborg_AAW-1]
MEVLEPTITTPLAVSKKKTVIAYTSAELKKTIENTPAKNDWSWLKTASVEDIAQYVKDKGRFGKGISRMISPEGKLAGASTFYQALRRSNHWNSIKDDPKTYKQVFGIDKQQPQDWSWLKNASPNEVEQYIRQQGRYRKGIGKIRSIQKGIMFYDSIRRQTIWNIIKDDPKIYKQVFGINKQQQQDRSWIDSASIEDIVQFVKNQGRYGKGTSWIKSSEGIKQGANAFYNALGDRSIRKIIKNNSKIYKQIFGIKKIELNDRSWLKNAEIDDITQYMKNQGRYGKGPGWMFSPEGKKQGACAFYDAIRRQRSYWDSVKDNSIIYKKVFGVEKITDRSWLNSASIDDITQYMKNKGRYGKGANWMRSPEGVRQEAYLFYAALTKSKNRNKIKNNSNIYKKIFGVDQLRHKWSRVDSASIDDITQYMKNKGRYGKGAGWIFSPEGIMSGFQKFYGKLQSTSLRETIKNDSITYKQIFGVDKKELQDWTWIDSASIDDIAQFMKNKGRFGKSISWIGSPEGQYAGACAFYQALRKSAHWDLLKNDSIIYKQVLGKSPYKRSYQDNTIEIGFDSLEERRIAIILYKLGIVEQREEGQNLHVRTNGSKQNSIDFKIGDTFLEYHPYNPHTQKHKGGSFSGEAQRKYDHITNTLYKNKFDLIVFDHKVDYYDKKSHTWKHKTDLCRSLFNIITETPTLISRIPLDKRYIMLDYKHFKDFYHQVAKELSDYDMQFSTTEDIE